MVDHPARRRFNRRLDFDFARVDVFQRFVAQKLGNLRSQFPKFLVAGRDVANQRQLVLYARMFNKCMHVYSSPSAD